MSHLSTLISANLPSETTAAQQKSYVTFVCLPPASDPDMDDRNEPTITLLERRHLISGSLTTGFRTWEAALHLGSYLLSPAGQKCINGKSVLELGAGTGFLAILAAKHLQASHVTTTDGDEGVVEALAENLFLNGLDNNRNVINSVLRWGTGLRGSWVEDDCEEFPYDVVIGADIVRQSVLGLGSRLTNPNTDIRQSRHICARIDPSNVVRHETESANPDLRGYTQSRDL
jgi:SAM-dependent methyltransferase